MEMELRNKFIGQEVRRIVLSLKKPSGVFYHVFSILEKIDGSMPDYEDFEPNCGTEYNDCVKSAPGKEDKLFLTVDRITVTEALYEQPWKDYYSGSTLLEPYTTEYRWPVGENDWRIIPSDESYSTELKEILPRRYCPQYVRYCIPTKQPDELSTIIKNEKLRSQLTELTKRNLGYDLAEHSIYLGGFVFLGYNDIYSKISFTEKDTRDGVFCRITYKNNHIRPLLKLCCKRKGYDDGVIDSKIIELDGSRNLYDLAFDNQFHALEVNIYDEHDNLLDFYNHLVFIHAIHFDMRVGDREVNLTDKDGNTIKTIQKYIEGDRSVIGDKNPTGGLLDSSPEYAYRKFEETLDFVFYDGDKDREKENIDKSDKDILQILNTAKERIYICDVFFDLKSLGRFVVPMASRTVPVKILSGKNELKKDNKREDLAKSIKEVNEKGIANVECRLLTGKKAPLHDRYIVADEQVWMLGCSLNEFGIRATTLIRVPKDYRQKLIDRAEEWWNDGTLTVDINDVEDNDKTRKSCFICKWIDKLCRR